MQAEVLCLCLSCHTEGLMDILMQARCQAPVHHVVIVMGCGLRNLVMETEISSDCTSYHGLWVKGRSHGDRGIERMYVMSSLRWFVG